MRENVFPAIPGAERCETHVTVPVHEPHRRHLVRRRREGHRRRLAADVPGHVPAISAPPANTTLADLIDGNLGENGVLALGFTNALYADVDGKAGFKGPRQP